jgi:NADH dehydrogenase FAD-containing subunit
VRACLAKHRDRVEVTLLDRNDYHQFQPSLYQVATSMLAPGDIAYPLLAGRTTIVISHRPAVAQEADAVVGLRRGRLSPVRRAPMPTAAS